MKCNVEPTDIILCKYIGKLLSNGRILFTHTRPQQEGRNGKNVPLLKTMKL